MLFHAAAHFVLGKQFATLRLGVTLFDLCRDFRAILRQPYLALVQQGNGVFDILVDALEYPALQVLLDQLFSFGLEPNVHGRIIPHPSKRIDSPAGRPTPAFSPSHFPFSLFNLLVIRASREIFFSKNSGTLTRTQSQTQPGTRRP